MKQLMNVTFAPHIRSSMDTFKIMLFVIISLITGISREATEPPVIGPPNITL